MQTSFPKTLHPKPACMEQAKQLFPRDGSAATPPHPGTDFLWKDYCPRAFRELRRTFSIDAAPYLHSICGAQLSAGAAPGRLSRAAFACLRPACCDPAQGLMTIASCNCQRWQYLGLPSC